MRGNRQIIRSRIYSIWEQFRRRKNKFGNNVHKMNSTYISLRTYDRMYIRSYIVHTIICIQCRKVANAWVRDGPRRPMTGKQPAAPIIVIGTEKTAGTYIGKNPMFTTAWIPLQNNVSVGRVCVEPPSSVYTPLTSPASIAIPWYGLWRSTLNRLRRCGTSWWQIKKSPTEYAIFTVFTYLSIFIRK